VTYSFPLERVPFGSVFVLGFLVGLTAIGIGIAMIAATTHPKTGLAIAVGGTIAVVTFVIAMAVTSTSEFFPVDGLRMAATA